MKISDEQLIFDYKTPFVLNSLIEGEHKSKRRGPGNDFYKKSLFLSDPNPENIDLMDTVKDPFESIYVRSYRQRSQVDVVVLVDGSDSMAFPEKTALISLCERSISCSVMIRNDNYHRFLIGNSIEVIRDSEFIESHFTHIEKKQSHDVAKAFSDIDRVLPERRSLVFIISDFHWSNEKLKQTFNALSGHYLIPVVSWCSAEYRRFNLWRFVRINDAETGQSRLVFVTPKQKQLIDNAYENRKIELNLFFQQFNCRPFWLIDDFNVQDMSEFFHGC